MTSGHDLEFILCDGDNCNSTVFAGNNLHQRPDGAVSLPTASWLIVVRDEGIFHFCPCCYQSQLEVAYGTRVRQDHQSNLSRPGWFRTQNVQVASR
jgi:hypothetical protein